MKKNIIRAWVLYEIQDGGLYPWAVASERAVGLNELKNYKRAYPSQKWKLIKMKEEKP
jgi:hypothetical protein